MPETVRRYSFLSPNSSPSWARSSKQKPRSLENRAKLGIPPYGNGWPGIRVRWCIGQLKTHLITKEVNRLKGELGAIHYVGIAADEAWRCKDERYPLVELFLTILEPPQIEGVKAPCRKAFSMRNHKGLRHSIRKLKNNVYLRRIAPVQDVFSSAQGRYFF